MVLASIAAQFRAHPIAATLEYGSLLVCILLLVGAFATLVSVPPQQSATPWLAIIGVGSAFVLFWTVVVPLYERTL